MILFVFEGEKQEPSIFNTIKHLFFPDNNQYMICSYGNNIYNLYRWMHETEEPEDIITILKKKLIADKNNQLKEIPRRSDFSQVYLFFDYDCHHNEDQRVSNNQIQEMLQFFKDESSDYGKLFINYPMVESIRYVKDKLPDNDYYKYTSPINLGKKFKKIADNDSYYKNFDFLIFKREPNNVSNDKIEDIRKNWGFLQQMNVQKANFICSGSNTVPEKDEEIAQDKIFKYQLQNYIVPKKEVAILNSFPLFLYEYTGKLQVQNKPKFT